MGLKFEKVGVNHGVETWYLIDPMGRKPNEIYGIIHSKGDDHSWHIYAPLGNYKTGNAKSLAIAKRRLIQERQRRRLYV